MAAKLGYKFVNPSLSGKEKDAARSIGANKPTSLPYSTILLSVNRLGATLNSVYRSTAALKAIEEVRAFSLKEDREDGRRSRRRTRGDEREASQESHGLSSDDVGKEAEKQIKKDPKSKGLLEKIFGPIGALVDAFAPLIAFAAIQGAFKFFRDPKNREKVQRLVEFAGEIFKFLYEFGTFAVSNVLNGLAGVFGGIGKFKEGNVLGGAWDVIMGFGQLLVGLVALKGLALFLNPFKLMGGILDLLDLSEKTAGANCPCDPSADGKPSPDDAKKPKRVKTRFQKFVQRSRILFKRTLRTFRKLGTRILGLAKRFVDAMAVRIIGWALNFYYNTIRPAATKLVQEALKSVPGQKAADLIKDVGQRANALKDGAGNLLNKGKQFLSGGIKSGTDNLQKAGTFLGEQGQRFKSFLGDGLTSAQKKAKDLVDPLLKGIATKAGQLYQGVVGGVDQMKKGWKWTQEMAAKGQQYVLERVIAPIRANIDNMIKSSPLLQKLLSLMPKGVSKEAAAKAFTKFADFVRPMVLGLKTTLGPLAIGPIDLAIESVFALLDLQSGTDPRRVALKLGGSVAGLMVGGAATAALGLGTGGIGAVVAGGVIMGASSWAGEQLGIKLADMMGIPRNPEGGFSMGGIVLEKSMIQVAENEPEVIVPLSQLKDLFSQSTPGKTNVLGGAEYLIGATSSILDSFGQTPGVQGYKTELSSIAGELGSQKLSIPGAGSGIKKPSIGTDLTSGVPIDNSALDLLGLLSMMSVGGGGDGGGGGEEESTAPNPPAGAPGATTVRPGSGSGAAPGAPAPTGPVGPPVTGTNAEKWKQFKAYGAKAGAKFPQLVAAQFALESGWGKALSASHNYFGIKAAAGESAQMHRTREETSSGASIYIKAGFKNFSSPQDAVNHLVTQWYKDYKGYKGCNGSSDEYAAATYLRSQGYATDSNYAPALHKLMGANKSLSLGGEVSSPKFATGGPTFVQEPKMIAGLRPRPKLASGGGITTEDILSAVGAERNMPGINANTVDPIVQPTAKPAVQPTAKPTAKPAPKPAIRPSTKLAANPTPTPPIRQSPVTTNFSPEFGSKAPKFSPIAFSLPTPIAGIDTSKMKTTAFTGGNPFETKKLTPMQEWAKNFPKLAAKVKPGQSGYEEIQSLNAMNAAKASFKDTMKMDLGNLAKMKLPPPAIAAASTAPKESVPGAIKAAAEGPSASLGTGPTIIPVAVPLNKIVTLPGNTQPAPPIYVGGGSDHLNYLSLY